MSSEPLYKPYEESAQPAVPRHPHFEARQCERRSGRYNRRTCLAYTRATTTSGVHALEAMAGAEHRFARRDPSSISTVAPWTRHRLRALEREHPSNFVVGPLLFSWIHLG